MLLERLAARASRGPRQDPYALAPGPDAFTAVLAAARHAADALARVAVTDTGAVLAAAQAGRLFVPTRSLPMRFDISHPYAPALTETVLELRDAHQDAAGASTRAAQCLDELAIEVATPPGPWAWHGRRPWPPLGGGAVTASGPAAAAVPVTRWRACRSPTAVPARACPGRSSGPSASAGSATRCPAARRSDRQRGPVLDRPGRDRQDTPRPRAALAAAGAVLLAPKASRATRT